jgi:hypothetical protein
MAGVCSVNNPSSLRTGFARTHESTSCLEIEARMPSEVKAISPLVERLIRLIEESHCVVGEELAVELALREALSNAVVYGNRLDPGKLVQVIADVSWVKGCPASSRTRGEDLTQTRFPILRLPRISRPSRGEASC